VINKKKSSAYRSVSAVKKIGLYKTPNFSKKTRIVWYAKQPRTKQPQFVVLGTATSKTGKLRYKVRDVNHGSKTYGLVGYITANKKYVRNTYYQSLTTAKKGKTKTITIINPKGVNAYKTTHQTGKVGHYRQGQRLKVKRIVHHNLTTRIQLANGRYITANRQWVQTGKVLHLKHARIQRGAKATHYVVAQHVQATQATRPMRLSPALAYATPNGQFLQSRVAGQPAMTTPADQTTVQLNVQVVKKIGLYSSPNFSKQTRITWYLNEPRAKQPELLIIGTAVSKDGTLRFKVRDINPKSKTYGMVGYITADRKYVKIYPNAQLQGVANRIVISKLLNALDWTYSDNGIVRYQVAGGYVTIATDIR